MSPIKDLEISGKADYILRYNPLFSVSSKQFESRSIIIEVKWKQRFNTGLGQAMAYMGMYPLWISLLQNLINLQWASTNTVRIRQIQRGLLQLYMGWAWTAQSGNSFTLTVSNKLQFCSESLGWWKRDGGRCIIVIGLSLHSTEYLWPCTYLWPDTMLTYLR